MRKAKKINIKEVIKNNPLIKESEFEYESNAIKKQQRDAGSSNYDILPPFTTKRRIKTSIDTDCSESDVLLSY